MIFTNASLSKHIGGQCVLTGWTSLNIKDGITDYGQQNMELEEIFPTVLQAQR